VKIYRATRISSDPTCLVSDPECEAARGRGGVIVLEFILVMPILFIATLAVFQFGILALVVQAGTTAVMEATREGAKVFASGLLLSNNVAGDTDPTGDDDIADRIALVAEEFLNLHGLEVRDSTPVAPATDNATIANAVLLIDRGGTTATRGDEAITCNLTGAAAGGSEIVVTLCFNLVDPTNPTGAGNPVPDWLSTFNMSLSGYHFEMTSRANLE
jgi:hypothetical protein